MRHAKKRWIAALWGLLLFGTCSVGAGEAAGNNVDAHDAWLKNAVASPLPRWPVTASPTYTWSARPGSVCDPTTDHASASFTRVNAVITSPSRTRRSQIGGATAGPEL